MKIQVGRSKASTPFVINHKLKCYMNYTELRKDHFLNFQQSTQLKTCIALCICLIKALVTELKIYLFFLFLSLEATLVIYMIC